MSATHTAESHAIVNNRVQGIETESGYLDFFPIVLVNTFAVLLTFNAFIFWAKSNVRSYLWRTTILQGDPLSYTGQGRELAIGFLVTAALFLLLFAYPLLIAINSLNIGPDVFDFPDNFPDIGIVGSIVLAVIVPVLISVIGFVLLFAPEIQTSPASAGAAFGVLLIGVTVFLNLSRFLAYRYLIRHTHWRRTSGDVDGAPLRYAGKMLIPDLTVLLTLGWSSPWRFLRRFDLLLNSARFAGHRIRFTGRAAKLYPSFATAWIGAVILTVIQSVLSSALQPEGAFFYLYVVAIAVAYFLGFVFCLAYYNARVFAHVAESVTFGDVRFRFECSPAALLKLFMTNLLMNVLSAGFSYYYSRMRIARFIVNLLEIDGEITACDSGEDGERSNELFGEGFEILWASSYF